MHFLVARRHVLDRHDDRLKLFLSLVELRVKFYDLLECRDLLLWLSRLVESGDQFISVRHAFAADLDWLSLFCGD